MTTVTLENISKRFDENCVLDSLDLQVKSEEFISLLGPSGCGKTTTLNTIAGFEKADDGHIYIGDRCVDNIAPHQRGLGMVFQNYALFPHMKVKDNVAFGLKMRRTPAKDIERSVNDILELVDLHGKGERYPNQLSGGEQQRVALARALVITPDVLLLDEPLSNLDAKLRKNMRIELRRIQQKVRTTTIYVTHDQEEALTLSDYVAVMNKGKIEQLGTPIQVYEEPQSDFVATFVGEINSLKCDVKSVEGNTAHVTTRGGAILSVSTEHILKPNETVYLAIRPEKIRTRPEGPENIVEGTVEEAVFAGPIVLYVVDIGGENITATFSSVGHRSIPKRGA